MASNKTNKPCAVYILTNYLDGKQYVGISINPVKRWSQHKAKSKKPETYFHNAINCHGADKFKLEVISWFADSELAKQEEIRLIATGKFKYNMTSGGDGVTYVSPEVRLKMTLKVKEGVRKHLSMEGVLEKTKERLLRVGKGNKGRSGQTLSDEHKRRISESMKIAMALKYGKKD